VLRFNIVERAKGNTILRKRSTFYFPLIFADVANSTVKFDEMGDGLARYTIYNYQRDSRGKTDYKVIGKWYNELKMDVKDVMWSWSSVTSTTSQSTTPIVLLANETTETPPPPALPVNRGGPPTSVCSLPCKQGQIMKMNTVRRRRRHLI